MRKTVTSKWLNDVDACQDGIDIFNKQFSKRTNLKDVIQYCIDNHQYKSYLLEHANWLITRCMDRKQCIKYAIYSAEQVLHIFEDESPNDDRPRKAIDAAKLVIENNTQKNREAASDASDASYTASYTASDAFLDAASYAARSASDASDAASDAASYAARYARYASDAASDASDAARYASDAASDARAEMKINILKNGLIIMGING